MLLDFIFDVVLVVVASMLILLVLFVALPGLVLYAFRWWRVGRKEGEAS